MLPAAKSAVFGAGGAMGSTIRVSPQAVSYETRDVHELTTMSAHTL